MSEIDKMEVIEQSKIPICEVHFHEITIGINSFPLLQHILTENLQKLLDNFPYNQKKNYSNQQIHKIVIICIKFH